MSDDREWQKLLQTVESISARTVKVGVLASQGGNEQHSGSDDGMTVLDIAAVHEFGSSDGRVPERSYIRLTTAAKAEEAEQVLGKIAAGIVAKKIDVEKGLNMFGAWMSTQIKQTITGGGDIVPLWPELKPATIARKGSDRPLVDTGQLVNSITWEVGPAPNLGQRIASRVRRFFGGK